jgi:hypothetical protein
MTVNHYCPGGRKGDAYGNPDSSSLSCSVKPNESYDLTVPNFEANGAYGWTLFAEKTFVAAFISNNVLYPATIIPSSYNTCQYNR